MAIKTFTEAQVQAMIAANQKSNDSTIANVRKDHDILVKHHMDLFAEADAEIAELEAKVASLSEMEKLKTNLYALSDTFHIAAKRIAETEDPKEEAKTLKALADQLLTVVGLPPRDPSEFE